MAYEDRQSGSGVAVAVVLVLVVLLGGFLALAVGTWFFERVSAVERQVVIEQNRAITEAEKARLMQIETELDRDQLLAEADPEETQPVPVQQMTIEVDKEGNAFLDGNSLQTEELQSRLRALMDESSGQLSIVVQVDDQCRFEHVARILSLCEEAGIRRPRLESSHD